MTMIKNWGCIVTERKDLQVLSDLWFGGFTLLSA